jgi:hypothetical protein
MIALEIRGALPSHVEEYFGEKLETSLGSD